MPTPDETAPTRPVAKPTEATTAHTPSPDVTTDLGQPASPTRTLQTVKSEGHLLVVPGYELLGEIARGGMGLVLAARDPTLEREVAVKVLLPGRFTDDAARRFVTESKITAQLPHPGIPPVHELGELPDGSPFLVMKLIRGQTLAALLANENSWRAGGVNPPVDPSHRGVHTPRSPELLQVFEQICHTVGFAHSRGVIHRDLKPANVMVGEFGEVQVMDWGLARETRSAERGMRNEDPEAVLSSIPHSEFRTPNPDATAAGAVLGTPAFMAPEQARGDSVDERADVFALGGILCAVLTGHPPFTGNTVHAVLKRAEEGDVGEAFTRLDVCGADAELIALAKRCLNPTPRHRPANGKAVADAVAAYRAGVEERLQAAQRERAAAEVKAAEQRKRRRVQLALALALGLLLVGGAAFAWWNEKQTTKQLQAEAQRESERQIEAAKNREAAIVALEQSEAAIQRENPNYGVIDAALEQARKRLADGQHPDLQARFDSLNRDRAMLAHLDENDTVRWALIKEAKGIDPVANANRIETVFREYGLDIRRDSPEVIAERIRQSRIASSLIVALNQWFPAAVGVEVPAVLDILDPNPTRVELRRLLLKGGDPRPFFERLRALNPHEMPPDFLLLLCCHPAVPEADGLRVASAGLVSHPNHFGLAMQLALRSAAPEAKVAATRIALGIRPENAAALNNLAATLARQGDTDAAMIAIQAALKQAPHSARLFFTLGRVHFEADRDEQASVAFRRSIELDPTFPFAYCELARSYLNLRRYDEALAAANKSLELDPNHAQTHALLGLAFQGLGQLQAADEAFKKVVETSPSDPEVWAQLAQARNERRDKTGAIVAYQKAIEFAPNDARFHTNLGLLYRDLGQFDEAVRHCREAVRLADKVAVYHYHLGAVLISAGKPDEAKACILQSLTLDATRAQVYGDLGALIADMGDLRGAIPHLQKAIELDPKFARAHENMGGVLGKLGELDAAIPHMRRAVELGPNSLSAHINLGLLLRKQGKLGESLAYFQATAAKFQDEKSQTRLAPFLQLGSKLVAQEQRITAILEGATPVSDQERLDLARVAFAYKKLNVFTVTQVTAILKSNPKVGDNPTNGIRFLGASAAALAGTGQGADVPPENERRVFRQQAGAWLESDLDLYRRVIPLSPERNRPKVHATLTVWLADPDLAGVRDEPWLAKLPEKERKDWTRFWSVVREVHEETAPPPLAPLPREK